ncbi:MAG: glycosyltransferase family 2 protein [Burkholderiaceae bacterium]
MSSVIGDDTRIAAADGPVVRNEDRREVAPVRISVIIPLFDKEPFIEAAVRSALDNGPGVFEVIVVDDGSRDRGADIVAAIDDPRINLIRKANGGVSSARNTGLDHATGDWIAFLDADDFWLPGFVAAIQTLIARYPQCAMVTTRYLSQDDDGRRTPVKGGWSFDESRPQLLDNFYGAMAQGHFCFTCSLAIRRDLIRKAGLRFPVGEHLGEDLEVTFTASEYAPVAFDPRPLVVYRDSNVGVRLSRKVMGKLLIPFFERLDDRLKSGKFPEHLRSGAEEYLRSHLKFLIYYAVGHQRRREGWELLRHRLIVGRPRILALMTLALILPAPVVGYLRKLKKRVS